MAKRRMFSLEIVDSDAFLTMPLSTQALYFHLGMHADDDGVVNSPRKIQKSIGAAEDDLKILVAKRFIIPIEESGIIVIKHWKINNYIQKDRYSQSKYKRELALLGFDENGAYKLLDTKCIQDGYTGKVSIDKVSIDNNNIEPKVITNQPNRTHEEKTENNDDDLF